MPAGVRIRAVLPARPAPEIRQRPQGLRRQQRHQAPQRAPTPPAGRRRQFPRLRGGHAAARPRLRLRRRHLSPPAPAPPAPDGSQLRQIRALKVPESRRRHFQPRTHRRRPTGDQPSRRRRVSGRDHHHHFHHQLFPVNHQQQQAAVIRAFDSNSGYDASSLLAMNMSAQLVAFSSPGRRRRMVAGRRLNPLRVLIEN
ncbi:hypothetical protein DH2020_021744 [Rehmannia glutinosa]|uniref:Uncharacterized protein n=1 Tax=Rehmannia glutinosa TaxID=99300 RepID=A0ABR0WCY2_REHGL